jgi:hypothetical protein
MQKWSLTVGMHRNGPDTYYLDAYRVPWFAYLKAQIFHQIFCKHLFGTWHHWTWLGNLRWAPDDFEISDMEYEHGKWHKSRRMPLFALADLHCKLNIGIFERDGVSVELTQEQYEKLGGTRESPDESLSLKGYDIKPE